MGFILFSCEDMEFTTPAPLDRITIDIALEDLNGSEAFLFSAYNRLINFNNYGRSMMLTADVLADNAEINSGTRYTSTIQNVVRNHISIWNDPANPDGLGYNVRRAYNAYRTINDANIVMMAVETLRDEDPARADVIRGEALFIRALSHHDVARVYGYEPGQEVGGFNLSAVIRIEAVIGASDADLRARNTNVEVYTQIETDLLEAISLLPDDSQVSDWPARTSKEAAQALLARVYLYWGRYADAASMADAALGSTSASLSTAANYVSDWSLVNHPEALFELDIKVTDWNSVDGVNNSPATYTRSLSATLPSSQGAIVASAELLASFEAGDVRRNMYVTVQPGKWESTKWSGDTGSFRDNLPLIRYSEVLLISAEGKARAGIGGLAEVNILRASRGLGVSTASGGALVTLIMNERRAELNLEGHRFFDLKRLGMDISKPAAVTANPLPYTDFRVLAPLNTDYLSVNNMAVDNPGY